MCTLHSVQDMHKHNAYGVHRPPSHLATPHCAIPQHSSGSPPAMMIICLVMKVLISMLVGGVVKLVKVVFDGRVVRFVSIGGCWCTGRTLKLWWPWEVVESRDVVNANR